MVYILMPNDNLIIGKKNRKSFAAPFIGGCSGLLAFWILLYKGLWQRLLSRQSKINWLVEKTETSALSILTPMRSTPGVKPIASFLH